MGRLVRVRSGTGCTAYLGPAGQGWAGGFRRFRVRLGQDWSGGQGSSRSGRVVRGVDRFGTAGEPRRGDGALRAGVGR